MQKEIESLKSKLTDRILYKDLTGKILNTGDICLVTSKDKICLNKRKNHNYKPFMNNPISTYFEGNVGVFVKINNRKESKLIFGIGNKKLKAFTFHDKDFFFKQDEQPIVTLSCIAGDYQNMDENWKKRVKYDNIPQIYEIITQYFNK